MILAALSGCAAEAGSGNPEESPAQTSDDEIINGATNKGDPAVIAIYGQVDGQEGGALCTSTLIAPRVLLTAAHCVADQMFKGPAKFSAILGTDLRDKANTKVVKVKEVRWDKEFNDKALASGHDIAVAILETPITDIAPIPFNTKPLTKASNGQPLRITGYGLANGNEQIGIGGGGDKSSAGIKRVAKTKQISVTDVTVEIGSKSPIGWIWGEANICSGDSGGPVLAKVDGVETIIGVNSYGMIGCIGSAHSTRVDVYADFVKKNVSEFAAQ